MTRNGRVSLAAHFGAGETRPFRVTMFHWIAQSPRPGPDKAASDTHPPSADAKVLLGAAYPGQALRLRNPADIRYVKSSRRRATLSDATIPRHDVPLDCAISEALAWIGRAQDHSASADGGVARHFCLVNGWSTSYPETTGYIIPTVIREARASEDADLLDRAKAMLDWLVSIQMASGAFQGGTVTDSPVVPVTFNTGQILMGLAAGVGNLARFIWIRWSMRRTGW